MPREVVLLDLGLHQPEQLHRRGHLLAVGLHQLRAAAPARAPARYSGSCTTPEQLHDAGICSISGTPPRAAAQPRAPARIRAKRPRAAARASKPAPNRSTRRKTLARTTAEPGASAPGQPAYGRRRDLDGRHVDAGRLDRGAHVDTQQPQHLERLRHGSRLSPSYAATATGQLRHQRRRAGRHDQRRRCTRPSNTAPARKR